MCKNTLDTRGENKFKIKALSILCIVYNHLISRRKVLSLAIVARVADSINLPVNLKHAVKYATCSGNHCIVLKQITSFVTGQLTAQNQVYTNFILMPH